jgi:Protein of unknown function (DUF1579)
MSHMVNMTKNVKSLWFISPEGPESYVFSFFDSEGARDVWNFQWDERARTMITTPRTPPPGVEAVSYHVHEADKAYYGLLMATNEEGELLGQLLGHKYRQPAILGEIMLGWWNKPQAPKVAVPDEVQLLEPFVGEWRAVFTRTPSDVSPDGTTWEAKVSAEWVLDGHFVLVNTHAEHYESKTILGYDAKTGTYRSSHFPSVGQIGRYSGHPNDSDNTLSWACETPPPDITRTSSTQFIGNDEMRVHVRDHNEEGELVMELEIELTRAMPKAACLPQPPTDITGRPLVDLATF